MNFDEKKINSYFMANFSDCLSVWMLCASPFKKKENLQKRAIKFLCKDCEKAYEKLLS